MFEDLIRKKGITADAISCIGDDVTDIPLLKRAGFSIAVADASEHVKRIADYITVRNGGQGAVREVCEIILHVQEKWKTVVSRYGMKAITIEEKGKEKA